MKLYHTTVAFLLLVAYGHALFREVDDDGKRYINKQDKSYITDDNTYVRRSKINKNDDMNDIDDSYRNSQRNKIVTKKSTHTNKDLMTNTTCFDTKPLHKGLKRDDIQRIKKESENKSDGNSISPPLTKRTHAPHSHTHKREKHKLDSNFTTDKKFKKEEVFVIDQGDYDDSDAESVDTSEEGDDFSPIDDGDDLEDVTGDRKATINRAEDIVVDEDGALGNNNNDIIAQSRSLPDSSEDEIITDSLKDGSSTQFLENNQMIHANELKGNYVAMNSPVRSVRNKQTLPQFTDQGVVESSQFEPEMVQSAKGLEKQVGSPRNRANFYKDITSPEGDPAMNKVISSDFAIDKTISRAISAQMEKDNELTQREASKDMKSLKLPLDEAENVTATGDFANIVEEATKEVEPDQNTIKPNNIFSPISPGGKTDFKMLESLSDKMHSPLSSFERFNQPIIKQNEPDVRLEVNPGMSSLSHSEQQLISSLDEAVRSKDVATEVATNIMMPMKEDTVSDRTVSPNEQLLDMLSKGKFQKPLPEEMLNKLSAFDPNKLYMQEEGLSTAPMASTKFAKVGQEYIPVHSVGVNMPKNSAKPLIEQKQLLKAEQMMRTDPAFLAQNFNILDAHKYNTLQDLSKIGEAIMPNHVVNVNQPPMIRRPHLQPPQTHSIQRPQTHHERLLNDLPEQIAKILADFRAKRKPPQNFEDALSDAPNHSTVDKFVPEKMVTLAEEHNSSPQCKWNPCLNGGLCTSHPDKYYCSCKPGWIGLNCEKRSNCFPNPCNHGTCWPNADGYTCTCKLGYKGGKCDMLDRCRPNPCKNHGECSETIEGVLCECAIGFKGRLCEMESKCEPINPCMNGGTCNEYLDHYHCTCTSGFRGQNCEAFIAPTKPPPTIPVKHEGPQAIPAPVNLSTGELHEIFTEKYTDSSGKIVTNSHESVGASYDGSSDPGASMVPHHPIPITSPMTESDNPLSDTSRGRFGEPTHGRFDETTHGRFDETTHGRFDEPTHGRVGAPSVFQEDKFIIHPSDEKETKPNEDDKRKKNASDITGNDDRYQTHLVQVGKNTEDHHAGVHVGQSIPESTEAISPNPHPTDADGERGKQMNIDSKLRVQDAHEGQLHQVTELQEVYVEPVQDKSSLNLNEVHGNRVVDSTDNTQTVVVNSAASTRSSLPKSSTTERSGNSTKKLKSTFTKQTNSTDFKHEITHLPSQKSHTTIQKINKINDKIENTAHQETLHVNNITKIEHDKADNVIQKINTQIQQTNIHEIRPSFSKQKDAYSVWRRKALINFHKRNPNRPLPKNTLSLSKNSLCPKFCRVFCDPWCVKIGCCKTTKDQREMFQKIEKESSHEEKEEKPSNFMIIEADPCDRCNENADCVNKRCSCKTGFHGNGVMCTIDNCLLCHLDAECAGERCVCKKGFFGDGYECKNKIYQKSLCSKCHKDADCIGGDCLCARGYFGNGTSCWPLPIPV